MRLPSAFAAGLLGAFVVVAAPAMAVDTRDPVATPKAQPAAPAVKKEGVFKRLKKRFTKQKKPSDKKSEWLRGYHRAHDLIYRKQDYAAAIVALHALKRDDHPDVANLIGFSSRKLGRVEDARVWYEKALVADPKHTRTWQYYGLWHLEQGNRLKAEEHLQTIQSICGQDCDDYKSLHAALNGNMTY